MGERVIRMIIALVFIPAFVLLVSMDNTFYYNILIAASLLVALFEYHLMLKKAGILTNIALNIGFYIAVIYGIAVMRINVFNPLEFYRAFAVLIVYSAFLMVVPLFSKDIKHAVNSMAFTLFGAFYIIVLGVGLILVRNYGIYQTLFLFGVVWLYDGAAYFVGTAFGKHKFTELISPKKSLEGLFGGIAVCVLIVVAMKLLFGDRFIPFDMGRSAFYAVIISLAAQCGDLAESLIKRFCGVKDSSNLVPGHGGVLDKMDSFLLAAPVFILLMSL